MQNIRRFFYGGEGTPIIGTHFAKFACSKVKIMNIDVYRLFLGPALPKLIYEFRSKGLYPSYPGQYSGFVPFKFQLTNSNFSQLKGKELMSGFELYIEDFDLAKTKEALRPKQGLFNKLLGSQQKGLVQPLLMSRV